MDRRQFLASTACALFMPPAIAKPDPWRLVYTATYPAPELSLTMSDEYVGKVISYDVENRMFVITHQ